jgi:hypothetical protein
MMSMTKLSPWTRLGQSGLYRINFFCLSSDHPNDDWLNSLFT